ncbi:ferritin-like domain-containing protein [Paraburkholderia sediminicola]|uniref:ferritin-like domain-containing protein n=1 Tax=Paraburkholderia sediminicola TaxID=458836 RepID=UPI0038B93714
MSNKIIARNLTAKAAYDVPGNPPSTRPESGVGNCYPGLEYDHRNLDRRFFPGLLIEYLSSDGSAEGNARQGARVVNVDTADVDLRAPEPQYRELAPRLVSALQSASSALLATGSQWYLASIAQGGKTINLPAAADGTPVDGAVVWRIVRSLAPAPVKIRLTRRDDAKAAEVVLDGWRIRFTDARTGVISLSFQPGELSQSLCSPWMHDFRDCACTYWASNHPDIVFAEIPPGLSALPSGQADDALLGTARVDWLRADRAFSASSLATSSGSTNTQMEMSHFEINRRWQDLAVVLENREIGSAYVPRSRRADHAQPYSSPAELRDALELLAGLEHLVILLYLYARYSVLHPEQARDGGAGQWPTLADDTEFLRHQLLDVAIGEMQHLRWVNQLLADIAASDLIRGWQYVPAVRPPALVIPAAGRVPEQHAMLAPLDGKLIELFISIEEPSGYIDGRYARATATLLRPEYPRHLYEAASTIARDGEQHFLKFRDIALIARGYGNTQPPYQRPVKPGDPADPAVKSALDLYVKIADGLFKGYTPGPIDNRVSLAEARKLMFDLDQAAEALALKNIGVPYLTLY